MYMGCNCGLAGYVGEETETPWWERLLSTGERLAENILRPQSTVPTYTPPYGPYISPELPSVYEPSYLEPAGETTNWLPIVLIGGAVLFFVTRK